MDTKNQPDDLKLPPIDTSVKLGRNVRFANLEKVNIFGCVIGDSCFIGPFVEITRGVTLGKNCTVESHSFLCTGLIIGDNVFIGHGVMFTNDSYPRVGVQVSHPKTLIGNNCSLGTNATILGGLKIGEYSIIGAGSVVTKDVPPYSIVAGNPGKILKQFSTSGELLSYIEKRSNHVK